MVCVNSYTQDEVRGANAPGGVMGQGGRRENQEISADFLVEKFPGLVRKVYKDTWENMPNRADVVVQWRKAAKRGKEYREILGLPPQPVPDHTDPMLGVL